MGAWLFIAAGLPALVLACIVAKMTWWPRKRPDEFRGEVDPEP